MAIVRDAPQRDASAPAKGAPAPIIRFWLAMAIDRTSRPHPMSTLSGRMNRPKLWRMPNDVKTISAAATSTNSGLRQKAARRVM